MLAHNMKTSKLIEFCASVKISQSYCEIIIEHTVSYQTCGDHFLKPFGLGLVIKVDTAHQIISCYKE